MLYWKQCDKLTVPDATINSDRIAEILWKEDCTPVSARFDDPYYSVRDGLAETRHVFLDGNSLRTRTREGFTVAELGFGTGLNALATLQFWREVAPEKSLFFNSFEAFPLKADEISRALARWPELGEDAASLVECWREGKTEFRIGPMQINVIIGDAIAGLSAWQDSADAWFLDGFSPAKNPEMWTESLMQAVAAHTRPGGTFATYTAAGHVRRALDAAGFEVTRLPGFAGKRHMSAGVLRDQPSLPRERSSGNV